MTEDEYMALARQNTAIYNNSKTSLPSMTMKTGPPVRSFDKIWQDLGRQVLEKSLSDVSSDRRKNRITEAKR